MTSELKDCPFCSAPAVYENSARGAEWGEWIECTECGARGPDRRISDNEDVYELWNTRRPISAEEVREAGELLREECKAVFGSTWNYDNTWRFVKTVARALGHDVEEDE